MADELAYKDGDLCSATLMSHATTSYLTAATNHWCSVCPSDGILGKSISKWRRRAKENSIRDLTGVAYSVTTERLLACRKRNTHDYANPESKQKRLHYFLSTMDLSISV